MKIKVAHPPRVHQPFLPQPRPRKAAAAHSPRRVPQALEAVTRLGQQAMARAKAKLIVATLHKEIFPAFELRSDEGKAIHKALSALSIFAGGGKDQEGDKQSAMASLMQRAMAAKK